MVFYFMKEFKQKTSGLNIKGSKRQNKTKISQIDMEDTTGVVIQPRAKIMLNLSALNYYSVYGEPRLIRELGITLLHENLHVALKDVSKNPKHFIGEEKIIKTICDEVRV